MVVSESGGVVYDAIMIEVVDRWYICSEANYRWVGIGKYLYTTPTLKFLCTISSGYMALNKLKMEMFGHRQSITVVYL